MSAGNKDGIVLNQDRSVEAQLQRAKEERQKKLKKQKISKQLNQIKQKLLWLIHSTNIKPNN